MADDTGSDAQQQTAPRDLVEIHVGFSARWGVTYGFQKRPLQRVAQKRR